jgi:hypothetical protein
MPIVSLEMTLPIKHVLLHTVLILCAGFPSLAGSFSLRLDPTGELFGPFEFRADATVTVNRAQFTVVKESSESREIERILESVVIPSVEFRHASLQDTLDYISKVVKSDPAGQRLSIQIQESDEPNTSDSADAEWLANALTRDDLDVQSEDLFEKFDADFAAEFNARIDLCLRKSSLNIVFKRVGEQAGYRFRNEGRRIIFFPSEKQSKRPYYTESFRLREEANGKTHGPFHFEHEFEVKIGETSLTLVTHDSEVARVEERLKAIQISNRQMQKANPLDCIMDLRLSIRHEAGDINFVCLQKQFEAQKVTFNNRSLSAYDYLKEIVEQAGCKYTVTDNSVIIYATPKP